MPSLDDKVVKEILKFVNQKFDNKGIKRNAKFIRNLSLQQKKGVEKIFEDSKEYSILEEKVNIYIKKGKVVEKYDLKVGEYKNA